MIKRIFNRKNVPWFVATVFAIAFVVVLATRSSGTPGTSSDNTIDGVVQDNSGRRVMAWIDPMYSQGPPHLYKSNKPGIAPDCRMKLVPLYADETPTATAATSEVSGYSVVSLSPERQQLIGVKLGKTALRDLSRNTRTVGRVAVDETRRAQIRTKFEGYVERLLVEYAGQPVRRGQTLMTVYSPELLATQQELILAARNPGPFGGMLQESARRRLLLWDVSPTDIDRVLRTGQPLKSLAVRSPVSGVVLTKNVVEGGRVMPTDTLYEIVDLSRVWVLADVYESEMSSARAGQTAQVSVTAIPGKSWVGRVTFVAPTVDPATRTVPVRIELDNPGGLLKPDMYANVVLQQPVGVVLAVPESAVLRTGTRSIVFVSRGNGQFEPREVQPGVHVEGFYEIRRGLDEGEVVVLDANFLVDSESRLKAVFSAMSGVQQ